MKPKITYLLYADCGREGEQSILISKSKEKLQSLISDVKLHEDRWWENEGNWKCDEEYKHSVPDLTKYIITQHIRFNDMRIKEIKEI